MTTDFAALVSRLRHEARTWSVGGFDFEEPPIAKLLTAAATAIESLAASATIKAVLLERQRAERAETQRDGWKAACHRAEAERDALAAGAKISIPTITMEQEFAVHYRRGFDAGKAERDALRKDAERYRWMRLHFFDIVQPSSIVRAADVETLDAAIDAALAQEGKK